MTREEQSLYRSSHIPLSVQALNDLSNKGFKYVQVKGFNGDNEADYVEPYCIVLVPMKELPADERKKDIYEPVTSNLLMQMAAEKSGITQMLISHVA